MTVERVDLSDVKLDKGSRSLDREEALHRTDMTGGPCVRRMCLGISESENKTSNNLPRKRKTGPSDEEMTPGKRKKKEAPVVGRKSEKIKFKNKNKNLITNHFIPLSTARSEGGRARGHREEPLEAVGGGTEAMPGAHAEVGTSQLLGGETVQLVRNVKVETIGCNRSAAGELANTGEGDNSCWDTTSLGQ